MIKKIFTILSIASLSFLTGCESIKTWWNELSLTDVAQTLSPTIQAAAKYTVYAVCDKNPDLKPIFIASANGVKLAISANAYSTEQIKKYIADALGEENAKWVPIVYSSMDTILVQYEIIYNKYINKEIEASDKANGFKILLTAAMTGVIEGANMDLLVASKLDVKSIEQKRIESNEKLRLEVSKLK